MLTPAENVYLKHYAGKFGNVSIEAIDQKTENQLDIVLNMRDGSDSQLNEITTLIELVYFGALKQVEQDGHRDNVCFMASGIADQNGLLRPLPQAATDFIRRDCSTFFFATFNNGDFMVFTDVDTNSERGKRFRTMFNTTDTAPRLARRAYVEEHAQR